jgi:hypothetical protein
MWRYDPGEGRKKHAWPKDEAANELREFKKWIKTYGGK